MSRGVTDVSNVKYKFKFLFLIQILVNINMVIIAFHLRNWVIRRTGIHGPSIQKLDLKILADPRLSTLSVERIQSFFSKFLHLIFKKNALTCF